MAASTDELLAVHEELLTLIRAGLPLDRGLKEFARDVPGRMKPLLNDLSTRLREGQDPTAALAGISSPEARLYAAVLAVGIKSGRPAAALEGIVSTVRRTRGFRSALLVEMIYPALVLVVGLALIVFSLWRIAPANVTGSERLDASGPIVTGVERLMAPSSMLVITGIGLTLLLSLWLLPRLVSAPPLDRRNYWRPLQQMRYWQSLAIFLDHLALLLEHQTPLATAIELAADAVAGSPLTKSARALAQRVASGETRWKVEPPMPAVVGWLLQLSLGDRLPVALRREAEHYRIRNERRQRWFTVYFPMLATLTVGVLCLVALVFINLAPLVNLYYQLSKSQP